MKKILSCIFFASIITMNGIGQNIDYSNTDSLKKAICKVWEMQYAEVGGLKMGAQPGVNMIIMSFTPDNKLRISDTGGTEKPRMEEWLYNVKGKFISLKRNKKEYARITDLQEDKLSMKITDTKNAPADLGEMKFILIPSNRKL